MKMKKATLLKWAGALAFAVLVLLVCRVTVIPDEVQQTTVNAAGETVVVEKLSRVQQYVADNWDGKVLPTVKERAVDMAQFVADAGKDLNQTGTQYGNRANETSAWSFCVKGEGKVVEIENAEKPTKTLLCLDLAPYDGKPDCKLFYGKVLSSNIKNAIRDGVGFLKLDDFENQVEFADLTNAFNDHVKATVLAQHAAGDLAGKALTFYGCISLTSATYDNFVVVPVELTVVGG